MPELVATPIAEAVASFHFNEHVLDKRFPVFTAEESLRQPAPHSNHAVWIFGHMIYSRLSVLKFIGREGVFERPWLPLFKRGEKLREASVYPSWPELLEAWREITPILHKALDEVSPDVLDKPSPEGVPSADKKISGLVNFFAYHEAYHAGQLGYITRWLGHDGPVG
jgi:hypothetical protein